jgi:hypothetical protein
MKQLYTYEEIQDIECYDDGKDIVIKQLPEYLFTWQEGNDWVNMWVTNNVMEREYSFYQFVRTLEFKEPLQTIVGDGKIKFPEMQYILGTFAQMLIAEKNNNTLHEDWYFKTGKDND